MVLAPYLGKQARQVAEERGQKAKITEMVALSQAQPVAEKSKPKRPSLSRQQWESNRQDEARKKIQEEEAANKQKAQDEASEFLEKIRVLAREDNYQEAETLFLKRLESKDLSALDMLQKVDEFRAHFEKLKAHFSSSDKKSI